MYLVISTGCDGMSIEMKSKAEVISNINEQYWGDDIKFLDKLPEDSDPMYWGESVIIIKVDKVVTPTPKVTIEKWTVE